MRNLSVMEQKQVVGGYYVVKVYKYSDASYLQKFYYNTEREAINVAKSMTNSTYHAIAVDVSTGRIVWQ